MGNNVKKTAQESSKSPKRMNILDLIIVFIVLLAVAGGFYYFTFAQKGGGDVVEIEFTVEFRGQKPEFADLPQIGDEVRDSVKGFYLGVITAIDFEPTTAFTWNQLEGRFEEPAYPGEYNVYLTITVMGAESDSVISTGDVEIRVGKSLYIKGKGYASEGWVTGLKTRKAD